eukprot:jgi/Mesvir1/9448/Mv03883-RA.1
MWLVGPERASFPAVASLPPLPSASCWYAAVPRAGCIVENACSQLARRASDVGTQPAMVMLASRNGQRPSRGSERVVGGVEPHRWDPGACTLGPTPRKRAATALNRASSAAGSCTPNTLSCHVSARPGVSDASHAALPRAGRHSVPVRRQRGLD